MDYREGEDGEVVVRYQNTYEDIPLEECYMDVKFEDGIVAGIERQWIEPVEEGSAKLSITEPITALLGFIDIINDERQSRTDSGGSLPREIPVIRRRKRLLLVRNPNGGVRSRRRDGKCRKIELVYYADKNGVSENILYDTAFPAWRIEYNGGRIKYISAFEQ